MHHISLQTYAENGKIVKEAKLDFGGLPTLWFKFPESEKDNLTDRADPFVHALIFPMMKEGGEFVLDGKVSRSVLDNFVMFCRLWNIWFPEIYKPVTLTAEIVADDYRPDNRKMITAFSGGLDAAYTTYKYKKGMDSHFKYDVEAAVMIWGADIPLKDKEQFDAAFAQAKNMTDDIDVRLIPVVTNYREQKGNWSYEYGSVVVACLEFFSKKYFYGAASDASIHHFALPWGMNPVTDPYLASDTFRFVSDGHEHLRTERAGFIKDWAAGLENLRVCWVNNDKSKNCGHCEKCVRTKLNFMAVGQNHLPSMPNDLSKQELLEENLLSSKDFIPYYQEIYDYASKHKTMSEDWLKLLQKCLKKWNKQFTPNIFGKKRHKHSLWWHIKNRKF